MSKPAQEVYGFMHICTINKWKIVVLNQLLKIIESGLYNKLSCLFCGVVGGGDISFLSKYSKIKILYQNPDITNFEFLTIESLRRFCKMKEFRSAKIFYIHTKGISKKGKPDSISTTMEERLGDWRSYLEYYIIMRYKECLIQLDSSDVVGVNWRGFGTGGKIAKHRSNHFAGNFWWARSDYIAKLGDVNEGRLGRCEAEFWIGKGKGIATSLFQADIDHYKERWPQGNYKSKIKIQKWKFEDRKSVAIEEEVCIKARCTI